MKKVVIDARELRTSTGRYIERLIHYLQEVDTDLSHRYVILLTPKDMDSWEPKSKRFTKVACPYKEFTFAEQLGLLWQIIRLKPDLIHFGMVQQPILYRGKIVTTMHDLTTLRFANPTKNPFVLGIKQRVYWWVNYVAAHKSAAVLTPTEFVKQDIARTMHANSRHMTVTYEGADAVTAEPEAMPELEDKQFVMYLGRPNPHKNLGRLIEAFSQLKQTMPDLHLVLAGKEDELFRRHARTVRQLGIPDVHFTGFVSDGQLRWLYQHTAVYVFPSLSEGFGLPALEAMNSGAPVASSNSTCLPELYGDAVLYFDPTDVNGMAKVIKKIVTNPELQATLRTAGMKQAKKYSWRKMAEETLAVYKHVLGER